jgi:diadenylate cyclase
MDNPTFQMIIQTIRSIVDILCVAYIIYFVYKLFEDTNSISIITGFIFVLAVNGAANLLGLKTVAWIFQYLVSYFVVLLVVLFQPEIRKVLTRIGQGGIRGFGNNVTMESLNEITEAVLEMGDSKTGGLIIIERHIGLKHLLEESTHLDAEVKSELIQAIFYKGNILHDGAIMVQGKRIVAANVMIPSIKVEAIQKMKKGKGTRHRAGVAVTADSDAVCIIVSEETGDISIAQKGKMEGPLPSEQFIRRMNEIFKPE